jgi:hypothetical protein
MTHSLQLAELRMEQLSLMREVLELIGRIRQIQEPIRHVVGGRLLGILRACYTVEPKAETK